MKKKKYNNKKKDKQWEAEQTNNKTNKLAYTTEDSLSKKEDKQKLTLIVEIKILFLNREKSLRRLISTADKDQSTDIYNIRFIYSYFQARIK